MMVCKKVEVTFKDNEIEVIEAGEREQLYVDYYANCTAIYKQRQKEIDPQLPELYRGLDTVASVAFAKDSWTKIESFYEEDQFFRDNYAIPAPPVNRAPDF